MDMNKTLVAYFSCTGTTRRAAQALAAAVDADVRRSLIRPPICTGEIRKAEAPSK